MRENRKWSVCKAAILKFSAKQDIDLKIKEMCHLEHKTPEQMPFKILRYLIQISRYEEKSEKSVCTEAVLDFRAKQDIVLKIKELCHLAKTKPEQMPFDFLNISSSSRDMSENRKWTVCTVAILDFPAKQDILLKVKELCHLEHKTH